MTNLNNTCLVPGSQEILTDDEWEVSVIRISDEFDYWIKKANLPDLSVDGASNTFMSSRDVPLGGSVEASNKTLTVTFSIRKDFVNFHAIVQWMKEREDSPMGEVQIQSVLFAKFGEYSISYHGILPKGLSMPQVDAINRKGEEQIAVVEFEYQYATHGRISIGGKDL